MKLRHALASFAIAPLFGCAPADAEDVAIRLRIVNESGGGMADLPLRVVAIAGKEALRPEAGITASTDPDGRVAMDIEAEVGSRLITLDNPLIPRRARHFSVGIELELVGRRALYIVELDALNAGTVGRVTANVAGPDGIFDDQLVFHPQNHAWSFPDQPDGMLMTSIGADLRAHVLEEREGVWMVEIELEKQTFTVR